MSRRRWIAAAGVAVLASIAVLLVFAPPLVPAAVVETLPVRRAGDVLRLLGAVLLLAAAGQFLFGAIGRSPPSTAAGSDERGRPSHRLVGGQLDDQLSALEAGRAADRVSEIRSSLRPIAVELVARVHDTDLETAREIVVTGEWTEDPRASAFFATEPVAVPLRIRLFDLLSDDPRRYRQARHAVDALAAYEAALRGETSPPGVQQLPDADGHPSDDQAGDRQ